MTAPAPPRRARVVSATLEHLGALMQLFEAYAAERGQATDGTTLQHFGDAAFEALRAPERHFLALALVGKTPVGMVGATLTESPLALIPRSLYVRVLYVIPECRRRARIGWALWRAVRGRARDLGVPLTAEVPYDKRVVRSWQRRGGRPIGVAMVSVEGL